MATRLDLHNKLKELLGLPNVYYQSPENTKMEYPAIRYSLSKISSRYADNINYSNLTRYEIIMIKIVRYIVSIIRCIIAV